MKKLLFLALLGLILFSCKKETANTQAPVQIDISGLTTKTSVSIKVIDITAGNATILDIKNQFGNTTYSTIVVFPGDNLQIIGSTNIIPSNLQNDGVGNFKYSFNGQSMGGHGGAIGSFTDNVHVPTL